MNHFFLTATSKNNIAFFENPLPIICIAFTGAEGNILCKFWQEKLIQLQLIANFYHCTITLVLPCNPPVVLWITVHFDTRYLVFSLPRHRSCGMYILVCNHQIVYNQYRYTGPLYSSGHHYTLWRTANNTQFFIYL